MWGWDGGNHQSNFFGVEPALSCLPSFRQEQVKGRTLSTERPQTSTGDIRHGNSRFSALRCKLPVRPAGRNYLAHSGSCGLAAILFSEPLQGRHRRNMAHSYISSLFQIVFSTKQRAHLIPPDHQSRLWNYLAGIARNHGMQMLAVGGTGNHVHMLVVLPSDMALSDAVRTLKANSSRWMREADRLFAWQQGYGAFSVSPSQLDRVKQYIANQAAHHRTHSFEQEFLAMLQAANMHVDPESVLT